MGYYARSQGAKLSERSRAIRRSRYMEQKRAAMYSQITKVNYGKEITTKLSRWETANGSGVGLLNQVLGLTALVQASNDWGSFANSYSLFNIVGVKITMYCKSATTNSFASPLVVCYDPKDNAAIASYGGAFDHLQYGQMTPLPNGKNPSKFKFKPKAIGNVPQRVGDNTESWGWIKLFGDSANFVDQTAIGLNIRFTVVFTGNQ